MNKLVRNIVSFSLRNKTVHYILHHVILAAYRHVIAHLTMPIVNAYPNITPTQEIVIGAMAWNVSAQEMEKLVTIPVEVQLNQCEKKVTINVPSPCSGFRR
jgi:heavy metal efflux system protein